MDVSPLIPALVAVLQLLPTGVTTNVDLVVFLTIGVLAGAHCLGMCGPLVGLYADRMAASADRRRESLTLYEVRQHALFNGGRVVGYGVVGFLFGLLGGTVFTTIETVTSIGVGVRASAGIVVGLLVMAGGLGYVHRGSSDRVHRTVPVATLAFRRISGLLTAHVDRLAGSVGILALGTVHAALPCPIIYPAYLYAFALGDPVRGGLSLAVLGIGTFPSLFVYGTALGSLSASHRTTLHRVLGVAFFVLGYILLSHGLVLLGVPVPHVELPYYQPLSGP